MFPFKTEMTLAMIVIAHTCDYAALIAPTYSKMRCDIPLKTANELPLLNLK
jgi:hypothetical protein